MMYESNRLTALRTISLRLRGAKLELEEAGLDAENMVESTAKLREQILAVTGIDILKDDGKNFYDVYEIILKLSEVWGNLDNQLEKSALVDLIAGKQNSNALQAILNNGEMLKNIYADAIDSENVAIQEQERWSDSIQAKLQGISGTFESISANMLSSDTFKSALDFASNLLDKLEKITESGSGMIPIFTALSTVMGAMGNGFFSAQNFNNTKALMSAYNKTLTLTTEEQIRFNNTLAQSNPGFYNYISNLNGAQASLRSYISYLIKTSAKTVALRIATTALNMAINGLIGLAISGLATAFNWLINSAERHREQLRDATSEIKDYTKTLDEYKNKILEVADSDKTETEKLQELSSIKDEISTKYKTEIEDLENVADARKALLKVIDEENKSELNDYYRKNKDQFIKQARNVVADTGYYDISRLQQQQIVDTPFQKAEVRNQIQDLFENFNTIGQSMVFNVEFGDNVEDYYNNLKEVYNKMSDIKDLSGNNWTRAEEKLYKNITKTISDVEKKYYDDDRVLETTMDSADKFAERLKTIYPKLASQSLDSWKEYLYKMADAEFGDVSILVKNALDNIFSSDIDTSGLEQATEKTNSALAEMLANLKSIDEICTQLSTDINDADESFEKLNSTIESNKEADKYFSASDIIELIELYPQLSNAIIETQYGYKIEEEALESLRDAKLSEKKIALQSQLDEAKVLYDSVQEKLKAYQSELKGINSVSDARVKAAQLEIELTKIQNSATLPHIKQRKENTLEQQIAVLNDYVSASESLSDAEEKMKALQVEINVLGASHDKLSDSTKDTTNALNEEKNAINDLNDAMKDAQSDINDLIELTMAMLKKEAEIRKENLKDQLDEYKALIDKQKELIDLEKEEADFKSDLAEKDKDYLKIQQELDSLSIEGASYSLEDMKRKEELQEELSEKGKDRTEFLYDHEVDVRKNALDKEADAFEDQINTQIKAIEDYLDKEGLIRQEAIDLINGKSEQFYNDLLNYTMTFTDKSRYEFDKLWTDAYASIMKYADGQLNVDLALMNILATLELNEQKLKDIEAQTNSLKNATTGYYDAAIDGATKYKKVLDSIGNAPTIQASDVTSWQNVLSTNDKFGKWVRDAKNVFSNLPTHHSGGIVGGESSQHGEILAKLLSGEVVVTESQARNFMENTLPKLSGNVTTNNSSVAPVINIGDIVVQGNADSDVISQLKTIRQGIADDVFKAINNQKNIFNGGRIRTV